MNQIQLGTIITIRESGIKLTVFAVFCRDFIHTSPHSTSRIPNLYDFVKIGLNVPVAIECLIPFVEDEKSRILRYSKSTLT